MRTRLRRLSSSFWLRLSLLILTLGGYALRLTALTRQNIWWDEARNIEVALRPFSQIAIAPELDIQPPLYFWLLHGWGRIMGIEMGMDPVLVAFVARYLSVAAGIVGVVLVYALTRRIAGPRAGVSALIVALLSPLWLAESQEARMYTLSFALLTAAALAWQRVIRDWRSGTAETSLSAAGNPPPRMVTFKASTFVLLSALALSTHYNAVFILVAWYLCWGAIALLMADRRRRLGTVIVSGLAMTVLVLPLAPIALRQIPTYANPNLTVPTVPQYLSENWTGFLGGYAWDAVGLGRWWLWAVLAVVSVGLAVGSWQLVTKRSRDGADSPRAPLPTQFLFLLFWLVGGLAFYYIAVMDRGAFNIRYSSFVTPALYALMGISLSALGRFWRWLPFAGIALLLVGLTPAAQADLNDPRFFREDTAGLAAWLRMQTGPGDVILVDQKYPFGFYYDRFAIDPEQEPTGVENAPAHYLFVDINTIDQKLTEWAGQAQRVFWVQWFESDTDPRGSVSFLLDKVGRRGGEQNFQGYWVQWWDLTPPSNFVLADEMVPLVHRWRNGPQMVEIDLPPGAGPGEQLPVVIRWQAGAEVVARPLKARVALYDAAGARLAQDDRRILNDRHLAPVEWADSDRPLNVYAINLPTDLPPGQYSLMILVYDAETLEALEVLDAGGVEVEIGSVEIGE